MIANIFSLSTRDGMPVVDVPCLGRPNSRMLDDLGLDARQWNGHTKDAAWRPAQTMLAAIGHAVHGLMHGWRRPATNASPHRAPMASSQLR